MEIAQVTSSHVTDVFSLREKSFSFILLAYNNNNKKNPRNEQKTTQLAFRNYLLTTYKSIMKSV